MAVNEATGDIYVADTGNHRIVRLDSAGNFISAWGWGVSDGNAASEVCTSGCQAGVPGNGAGQFTTPRYIEVDNSGGASEGDVYVGDEGPGELTSMKPGVVNWPAPEPAMPALQPEVQTSAVALPSPTPQPQVARKFPDESNLTTRWLPVSAT